MNELPKPEIWRYEKPAPTWPFVLLVIAFALLVALMVLLMLRA